jgi:hypothetical protein
MRKLVPWIAAAWIAAVTALFILQLVQKHFVLINVK